MRVLCFGDSNTYGYDPRSYLGGRYPADCRWVDLLGKKSGWAILNAGENGREIPRREGEIQALLQMIARTQPLDRLLIMLGINDLLQGADAMTIVSRMEAFLTRLPLAAEQIALIAPPSLKHGTWTAEMRLTTEFPRLISAYETLANQLGIRFVDTRDWDIECTFDGVHFSEQGSRDFAEQLWLALKPSSASSSQ